MASGVLHSMAAQALLELGSNKSYSMRLNERNFKPPLACPTYTVEQLLALYESPKNKAFLSGFAAVSNENDIERKYSSAKTYPSKVRTQIERLPTTNRSRSHHSSKREVNFGDKSPKSDSFSVHLSPKRIDTNLNAYNVNSQKIATKRPSDKDFPLDLSVKKRKTSQTSLANDSEELVDLSQKNDDKSSENFSSSPKSSPRVSGISDGHFFNASRNKQSFGGTKVASHATAPPPLSFHQSKSHDIIKVMPGDCVYGKFKFNRVNKEKSKRNFAADQTYEKARDPKQPTSNDHAPFVRLNPQSRNFSYPMENKYMLEKMLTDMYRRRHSNPATRRRHHFSPSSAHVSSDYLQSNQLFRHKHLKPSIQQDSTNSNSHEKALRKLRSPGSCLTEKKSAFSSYSNSTSPLLNHSKSSCSTNLDSFTLLRHRAKSDESSLSGSHSASNTPLAPVGSPSRQQQLAKNLFSNLGDWSYIESEKCFAFGKPAVSCSKPSKTLLPDCPSSSTRFYDEKYLSTKTKNILKQASVFPKQKSTWKPKLVPQLCSLTGLKHNCPGCKQKFEDIPSMIIEGFWKFKKFDRYTHSSSSSSPEVVYCSQLKCKTATAASAGRTASSMPSSVSSYLPNHLRHLEINSKNGRIVRHLADMHRATEMNKRVQSHGITADAPVDDSSDDDLLANNIEESSDEEDDQSIKELELRKASNKRTSFYARLDSKQQKNKRSAIQSNVISSTQSNLIKSTQNNLIQMVLARVLAREDEEKDMHLSDLEISDDDESDKSI